MNWLPIHQGSYINWGVPAPLSNADPYLVWADGCGFAPYGGPPQHGKTATLIELRPGKTVDQLVTASNGGLAINDIPGCYRGGTLTPRFLTAWPNATFFQCLQTSLASIVARAEISLPVIPERPRHRPLAAPVCGPAVQRSTPARTLIGVIDDGCAFAHYRLRDSHGNTRVRRFWDQDDHGAFAHLGSRPADFGRGHEIDQAGLQALINSFTAGNVIDEDACYASAKYDRLRRAVTHGAHVTDAVTGAMPVGSRVSTPTQPPSWNIPSDNASADETGIVFVQLPRACLQDPSGAWLDLHVLDAMRYILSCAHASTEQVVVNLSFGPQRGPNNGSAMLEAALAELSSQYPNLTLTLAGGNSFQARSHAVIPIVGASSTPLHWHVMPSDETPSFLQVWLPPNANGVEVRVTPPQQPPGPWIAPGQATVWPSQTAPACGVIFPPQTSRGLEGTMILVALQPCASYVQSTTIAPHGLWTLELRNTGTPVTQPAQAWIDRDDFNLGMLSRGRQSNFVDPLYDPLRYLESATDDTAGSSAVVRRRGSLTGISTGSNTLVAAGYRFSDGKHVRYSSAGPTRGAVQGPDCGVMTDQSRSLPGVLAAGTRGASVARLIGTSTGAPQLARWVLNGKPPPGPVAQPGQDMELLGTGLLPPF